MGEKHITEALNEAQLFAIAMAIAPTVINYLRSDLDYRFETLAAIQKDQDTTTIGIYNMAGVPGITTPPRTPHPEVVVQRHELESVRNYAVSLRTECLAYCKTHKQTNADDSTTTVIDEPETPRQRKWAQYIADLDRYINGIEKIPERETQRFIDDFRPGSIIHRTLSDAFLGRTQGQKHISISDRERKGMLRTFREQGVLGSEDAKEEEAEIEAK